MKNVPKTIYLHFRDEKGNAMKTAEATWGEERLYRSDVEYLIVEDTPKAPILQRTRKPKAPRAAKTWDEIQQTLERLLVHRVTPEGRDEYRCHACRGWYDNVYILAHARYCKSCYTAELHSRKEERDVQKEDRDEESN